MAEHGREHQRGRLNELAATAICGNDITSSCLYVSAFAIIAAGKWAPVSLLMVAAVLFLYRKIYAEVVGALPLNGGAYNALLNTTSKFRASIAACLTILSYMATAVISATEAMHYVANLVPRTTMVWVDGLSPGTAVIGATIGLLAVFMGMTILGINESSRVAIAIFITHLLSLGLLLIVGLVHVIAHGTDILVANLESPLPHEQGLITALLFGFCAAMLGVSGFESSANYVEEQAEGVFPKTLRNMWIAVTVINPVMALMALALVPIAQVGTHKEELLAHMGTLSGGIWLNWLISINAALVLSGAVLTSFVGVTGLVRRMTLDRCLPQFLLARNRRGTPHRIIIGFFLLAVSVLLITRGEIVALAGVYTLSFLAVMILFGLGNILLKVRRARLPRPTRAGWTTVLVGIAAVFIALAGNAVRQPAHLKVFLQYFIPAMTIVMIMLGRITLLKGCLFGVRVISVILHKIMGGIADTIRTKIDQINAQQLVFFTRGDNVANLNNVMLYVRRNEHSNRVKVVTVARDPQKVPARLEKDLKFLDNAYPEINIEFVVVEGSFGPKLIRKLAETWRVPVNLMFIGSPTGQLRYDLAELGGVRMII